jgi:hypothetical protein
VQRIVRGWQNSMWSEGIGRSYKSY